MIMQEHNASFDLSRQPLPVKNNADSVTRSAGPADQTSAPYVGRFAPSPSGPLHQGSLVAAMASYLDARAHAGKWLLRIEDVDMQRTSSDSVSSICQTLDALGMHWDDEILQQSRRGDIYQTWFDRLGRLTAYPCGCTRREIVDSRVSQAPDGAMIYPGTCREGLPVGKMARSYRLRTPDQGDPEDSISFVDRRLGLITQELSTTVGDFVLKRADGFWSYQMAVVVDDAMQGVTDIVRGADLLDSTGRQIYLQKILGLPHARYLHVPVITNFDGTKLSKHAGAMPIDLSTPHLPLVKAAWFLELDIDHVQSVQGFWEQAIPAWRAMWSITERQPAPTLSSTTLHTG